MSFFSEEARLSDPVFAMIPTSIWKQYFKHCSREALMRFIDESGEVSKPVYENEDFIRFGLQKIRLWFLKVFHCTNVTTEKLIEYAHDFEIDSKTLVTLAAAIGHIPLIEHLGFKEDHITCLFTQAARHGHIHLLKKIFSILNNAPEIDADPFTYTIPIQHAAENGQIEVLEAIKKHLTKQKNPSKVDELLVHQLHTYYAIINAAQQGQLEVVQWFWKLFRQYGCDRQGILSHEHYKVISVAMTNHHYELCAWFLSKISESSIETIISREMYAAVKRGDAETLKWLFECHTKLSTTLFNAQCSKMLEVTIRCGYTHSLSVFLTYAPVATLSFVHQLKPAANPILFEIVNDFVSNQLNLLYDETILFEQNHSGKSFEVDESVWSSLYLRVMLKHLIIHAPQIDNFVQKIKLILAQSCVSDSLLQGITPGVHNELLRVAIRCGNREAIRLLLEVPEIREDAMAHHFYQDEAPYELDLARLSGFNESSMVALASGEMQRFSALKTHYQPMIEIKGGVELVFAELKETLKNHYLNNPAFIVTEDGEKITLPLDWNEFKSMALNEPRQKLAYQAYYNNKAHTAYYYLQSPNPRMSPEARYINRQGPNAWSSFEIYKEEIVCFYLAASDPEISGFEGITSKDRLKFFVDSLSMIGRAHNWDKMRPAQYGSDVFDARGEKVHSEGEPVLDADGQAVAEEYDDGEGDKPSCPEGFMRRLVGSVLCHPLLDILTQDSISQELGAFIHKQLFKKITPARAAMIQAAWLQHYCYLNKSSENLEVLKQLNINSGEIHHFKEKLAKRYGEQFYSNPCFEVEIDRTFALDEEPVQAPKLAAYVDFSHLFTLARQKASAKRRESLSCEFFYNKKRTFQEAQADEMKLIGLEEEVKLKRPKN